MLWLILAFFNAAGLMLLVGAEFIAMLLVIVYVGAVAVLFLFVVMMLDIDFASLRSGFTRNLPFGIIIALVLLGEVIVADLARKAGPSLAGRRSRRRPVPNIVALGQLLYSRYLFAVRDRRTDPAGGDGRRDRPHAPEPRRHAHTQGFAAGSPPSGRCSQAARSRRWRGDEAVIGLNAYLIVAAILFTIGVLGIFLNRRNVILMLMAIELILLAVNINLVAFSAYLGDLTGQVLAMFVLTVAAAEAAIGLAILVIFFRRRGSIAVDDVNRMHG